ncbi:hypothetical protein [Elstera sp.]|jgi:hypothetical protein|uniref:hypothetical protein n=1 Tax=Elstera sp. TaxID=1916664 RepID=UPI0037BF3C83
MIVTPHPTLRCALRLDALASGATCGLLVVAAGPLSPLFGLPHALLFWLGLGLLPYAAFLIFLARRPTLGRGVVRLVIALNGVWVIDSLALLLSGWVTPTLWGTAFVLGQALAVASFAGLQAYGLRFSLAARLTPAHA